MNCTPAKCPHRELLEKARSACLGCAYLKQSNKELATHGGMVSFEAAGERTVEKSKLVFDRSPRGQVTNLPGKIEEHIAKVFREWCSLDTIDALLMLHISNGGTPQTFGSYLQRVAKDITAQRADRDNYRATAWAKFQALIRKFKPLLKSNLHAWNDGHGGAIRQERLKAGEHTQTEFFFGQGTVSS